MATQFNDNDLEQLDINSDILEDEYNSEYGEEDEEEDNGKTKIVHIIFLVLLIIMIGIIAFLLIRWQKGIKLGLDSSTQKAEYATEPIDFYVPFHPEEIEGYTDDGEYNIYIFSDGSAGELDDPSSVASIIAAETGANVTVLNRDEGTISLHEKSYTLDHPEDAFSLYYIIMAITSGSEGDYDLLLNAAQTIQDDGVCYQYWDTIHPIDFSKADVILLYYGMYDYLDGREFIGEEVYSQQEYGTPNSVNGAMDSCLKMLNERFPYTQILVASPSFFYTTDKKGNKIGCDMQNNGAGTLGEYVVNLQFVAQMRSVTFIDNYFGLDFNAENTDGYLGEDGMPNDDARQMIARHIIENIYFMK